jgi:hypothetical protein
MVKVALVWPFSGVLVLVFNLINLERKFIPAKLACERLNIKMEVLMVSRSTILINVPLVAPIELAIEPLLNGLALYHTSLLNVLSL